eukprot:7534447-Pyramimonas_sp.AAC.1
MAQDGPRRPERLPRRLQDGPRGLQEGPDKSKSVIAHRFLKGFSMCFFSAFRLHGTAPQPPKIAHE